MQVIKDLVSTTYCIWCRNSGLTEC